MTYDPNEAHNQVFSAYVAGIQAPDEAKEARMQKPYLNLGCGRVILPCEQPAHHALVDPTVYTYPLFLNVDRNAGEGVDECADVFTYPFQWADNSFDGALLSHLCEHIPHEIRLNEWVGKYWDQLNTEAMDSHPAQRPLEVRRRTLAQCQDGWFAFFSELYRVLTNGAIVHILSPYATSTGALIDPSHTRYLMPSSFLHSMAPDPNAPFNYSTGGIHFEMADTPRYAVHQDYAHLTTPGNERMLERALEHEFNVCYEFYIKLRVVK